MVNIENKVRNILFRFWRGNTVTLTFQIATIYLFFYTYRVTNGNILNWYDFFAYLSIGFLCILSLVLILFDLYLLIKESKGESINE